MVAFTAYKLAIILPSSPFWNNQSSFETILNSSNRIIVSSLIAYGLSEFANSYLIAKIKILTNGSRIWLRIITASIFAITIDNFCFMIFAYYGVLPVNELIKSSSIEYLFSLSAELLCVPIIIIIANNIKKHEKLDTIDINTNFTPFSLDGKYTIKNNKYVS